MIILSHVLRCLGLLALGSLLTIGCKRDVSQQSSRDQSVSPESTSMPASPEAGANLRVGADSIRTRGLTSAEDFDLVSVFPQLYGLVRANAQLRNTLSDYAQRVVTQQGLNSEADLMALFRMREETILPRLTPFFENEAEAILRQFDRYERELNQLGMSMIMAEGTITGLGPMPMLEETVDQLASPAFQTYQRFLSARTESYNGEYPFMNMEPYEEMVLAGEELMARRPNPYWQKVKEDFERAVSSITDLHVVQNASARAGEGTPLVGGINQDFYPYAAEIGRLRDFAERHPQSGYAQAAQKIAQNPSQMSEKPQNLYVIVLDWAQQERKARQQVQQYLRQGEDIPHYLPIERGDGTVQYAISYRFFEDSDRADEALLRIRQRHPEAEMIFCSVKGDKLYQVGPTAG